MANGGPDMLSHIRFGEPFPVRFFPNRESAKAYVLSGLDEARGLLLGAGDELAGRVAGGVHDIRSLVAADRVAAAFAASAELRAGLGAEATRALGEVRRRLYRLQLEGVLSIPLGFLALYLIPTRFGIVPATAVAFLVALAWVTWYGPYPYGRVPVEAWRVWEKVEAAEEIERAVAAVSDFLYRLNN